MAKKKIKNNKSNSASIKLEKKILNFFLKNSDTYNYKQIASKIGLVNPTEREALVKILASLTSQGKIVEVSRGKFENAQTQDLVFGKVDKNSSGDAYIVVEGMDTDVFVKKKNCNGALHNDEVSVHIFKFKKSGKAEGEVVNVVKRARSSYVGKYQLSQNYAFVVVENPKERLDIFIPKERLPKEAMDGDIVSVKIVDWKDTSKNPYGAIEKVIGKPGEHETEIHAILAQYGLPAEFPVMVEQEAENLDTSIKEAEIAKRRDFRKVPTFTIDPKDAKDFDDALSVQKLDNGLWEVGIHIADVTHYLQEGTILDEEAYSRATSVYLVDRVVPMLPEVLSNFACSLRPNEEKYTFSCVVQLDEDANVIDTWIGRTVIYSDRRFTYEEAQDIIEGSEGDFKEEILQLQELAKVLRQNRMRSGAIAFDSVEVKFNLDEENNPLGVYFKTMKDANHLIEEFMLLANKKVAEYIGKNAEGKPSGKTFIYRIHDDPDDEKLAALKKFVHQFGYSVELNSRKKISTSLNTMLGKVKGKGEANMIEKLTVRTMSKAKYSTDNIGHYGLAFDYYSHFTSPIRRYPDVMVHRLLQHYLDGGKPVSAEEYEEKCNHSSAREKLATEAERESTKYMQIRYIDEHIGTTFEGVISGITEWGIYVELVENRVEGMIRVRNLHDDHYSYDPENFAMVGNRTGKTIQLGDTVKVQVVKTDLEKRQIDMKLVD